MAERAGVDLCPRGPLAAPVVRFAVLEYSDSHKGIKRRDEPTNGLYGGLLFLAQLRPAGHRRKNAACKPLEGLQAAERTRGI